MNKHLQRLFLAALILLSGGSSAWAAQGDVTVNADIDFSNAINNKSVAGTVGSMTWTQEWTYAPTITDGIFYFGNFNGGVVELQNNNIRKKDKVTISFDLAFSKLSGKHVGFHLEDADGNNLLQQWFDAYNGDFDDANPLGLDWSKMYRSSNTFIWERKVQFTIVIDYAAKKINTSTKCYMSGASKPVTDGAFEVDWTTTAPIAKFVLDGNLNNSGRPSAFDNLKITTTEGDYTAAAANYTVKYVCGSEEIKDAVVYEGDVDDVPAIAASDKANFSVGDNARYIYVSDDAASKTIASDGSTVVTITFREAEKWNYTIKAGYSEAPVDWAYMGEVWEDLNTATVSYPRYLAAGTQLVERAPVANNLQQTFTVTSNGFAGALEYTAVDGVDNLYLLSEAEELETTLAKSATSFTSRVSGGQIIYGAEGKLLSLPAGKYIFTLGTIGGDTNSHQVAYTVKAGAATIAEGTCTGNFLTLIKSEEFTLTENTPITFTCSDPSSSRGIDLVYVQKTADVNAGISIDKVANLDGQSENTGTTYFYQQPDGTLKVQLQVTVKNTGEVALDHFTLTPVLEGLYGGTKVYEDASVTINEALAVGEEKTVDVDFYVPFTSGWGNWYVRENITGVTSTAYRYAGTVAYEPKFVFRAGESTSTSSITVAEAWGAITEATTKTYQIFNDGTAPLTVKSITLPDGFTSADVPAGEFTVEAGAKQVINITQPATEYGAYNGTLTIVYLDKNGAEQTYTLGFSANYINVNAWTADFNNSTSTVVYPAGVVAEAGISNDYQYISSGNYNNWITGRNTSSYQTENNKFITPLLHANAGDKLSFDVKAGYSSKDEYYVKVYTSTDRKTWGDPVATYVYSTTGSSFVPQSISFPEAGDYYVAFALYGSSSAIDNLIGLEKVAVAHDLYIKEVSWPDASIKSGVAQTKPSVDIIPLTNETADAYTVKYIYGDNVVEIASKALTTSASSTTNFAAKFTPEVEQTTKFEGTKVVFEFQDGTKFETEPFDLTVTNEPMFYFLDTKHSSKWYAPSSNSTSPVAFGKTNEEVSKTFWILNWGSAPLTVKSIAVPEGFTASVSEMAVPAFDGTQDGLSTCQQSFDVTFTATEAGTYSGDIVVTYVDAAGEDATFTRAISGTKLDPAKFYANFDKDGEVYWPAGSANQSNVDASNTGSWNAANYVISSSSTTNNLFITPKLKAQVGDKMQFDAKLYSSYWSEGKVVVYSASTRDELINFDPEADTRNVIFSTMGAEEQNLLTTDWQTFEFAVPAGEQYIGFEISGRSYVDEIYGLQTVAVPHDLMIASATIPETGMQNVAANATVNVLNLGLQAEESYKVLVHVGDEVVSTIDGTTVLPMEHRLSAAGTALSVPVQSPKAGTFPVVIELKAGAYSVSTEPVEVTFTEEVASSDLTIGTPSGTSYESPLYLNYKNSESITLYNAATLTQYGLAPGAKINKIVYKGYKNTDVQTTSFQVYYQWTDDQALSQPTTDYPYAAEAAGMTKLIDEDHTWNKVGSQYELDNMIVLDFSDAPLTYEEGKSLKIYMHSYVDGYKSAYFEKSNLSSEFCYQRKADAATLSSAFSRTTPAVIHLELEAASTVLTGVVKNAVGEPVEGATVTLVSTDGANVQYTGTTDAEGAYTINVIQATRDYTATVLAGGGYRPATATISFGGESKTQDFVVDMPLDKYFVNLDLSSTEGWTADHSGSFWDFGTGLIGTYQVRGEHPAATVDETHLATEYAFGLEARWASSYSSLNQTSLQALPEGDYTLVFDVQNTNGTTTAAAYNNLFRVTIGDQQIADESTEWMQGATPWTEHAVSFTIADPAKVNISFGYGTGSNNFGVANTPALYVSHVQLMTQADYLDHVKVGLQAEIAEAQSLYESEIYTEGKSELSAAIGTAESALAVTTVAEVFAAIDALKAAEKAYLVANNPEEGYYYVYSPVTGKFLSRGNAWGTAAVVDDYGVAVNLKLNDGAYTLSSFDWGTTYGDDAWMFCDAGGTRTRSYELTKVMGGYTMKNTTNEQLVYVYLKDNANKYRVAGNAIMGDNCDSEEQTVWQFLTKAERDAIVAQRLADQGTEAFAAAGVPTDKELKTYDPVEVSFTTGHNWTATVVRPQDNQPATNANGTEMWQATGLYTQTVTGLPKGLYRIDVRGFYRNGGAAEDEARVATGYNTVLAYLEANGNKVQLQTWTSGKGEGNDPNSMTEAKAKFDEGKYVSSFYTYVGEDGKLDLTLANPGHIGNGWMIVGGVTYTRTKEFIRGDLNDDDVVDAADLAIKQAEGREAAKPKMNADVKAALNAALAVTADDGEYLDVMDAIDAAIADAQASAEAYAAVAEVAAAVNKTNVFTPEAYIAYANDEDRKATVAAYNAGTLTDQEAIDFRDEMFTRESVYGQLMLSAWDNKDALNIGSDGSLVASATVTATMKNVEAGIYDVTANALSEGDVTFLATGRDEAVAIAAEMTAEAELKEQGDLTFTFSVAEGASVIFANLWFELNAEKTAGQQKDDELAAAQAKLAAARADLAKALEEAQALVAATDMSKITEESKNALDAAIAAAEALLADETVPETTAECVALTKEVTAAAQTLRTAAIEVKKEIAVGIDAAQAAGLDLDAPMYDVNGKRVDRNYRGIVIQNGRKFRRK